MTMTAEASTGPLADAATRVTGAATPAASMRPMALPRPRGPVTEALIAQLTGPEHAPVGGLAVAATEGLAASDDLLLDDDLQLALFLMYELHYGGLEGVPDTWEWDPRLLAVRVPIEREFGDALRHAVPQPTATRDVPEALFALVGAAHDGPGLSDFVERDATAEQVREILACRTIYTLKEADPHSWAIPRLHARASLRSSRSRPTSTAGAGPSPCTRRPSRRPCAAPDSMTGTARTPISCPSRSTPR